MDAFGILVGHLVGDYLLQNDWLANNKKQSTPICLLHVLIYTLCVFVLGFLASGPGKPLTWPLGQAVLCLLTIGIPHFCIDRTKFVAWWMQEMGQSGFAKPPLAPWSVIVVDNVLHLVCLYILYRCLL